ncbi:MAG: helix-turn-helix domain-containing protein [Firmicutes bacterium]|jgi:excisionase family DNA binding protein|nr:helix-turn-helix domain-containing protein [Bacillota bacterium]
MEKAYYTVDETAEKLGVHSKTIRRYIYSGKIGAQKVAGQWRIYGESIDQYLNQCECNDKECGVSKDDFCVFMDSESFSSDDVVQVCTIVDYYVEDENRIKDMVNAVVSVVTDFNLKGVKCKFNYTFDPSEKKVRMVFWGSPTFIESVVVQLKPFE